MPRFQKLFVSMLLCTLLLGTSGSCALIGDFINPDLAELLGISSGGGVVIVAFNNTTDYTAIFEAFESVSATDLTNDSRQFSVEVTSDSVANEVLNCPLGLVYPIGATVVTTSGVATAVYAGPELTSPDMFSCGDVIEFRLEETRTTTTNGTESTFNIVVQVVPGQ